MNYTVTSTDKDFRVEYNCGMKDCPDCPECNPQTKPDKDYFQSVQEEYGKNKLGTDYLITQECEDIKNLLLEKNRKYGNSATSSGILFDIPPVTALKARLNDKFARLKNDNKDEDEDIIKDILGYLILLRIAIKQQ